MEQSNVSMAGARQHCIGDILRRTARRVPDKTAILCGEVSWTYRQFDRVCDRIANALIDRGVRQGDRVAILSRNSHAFAAMRFAIARMGAILVPVNFMLNADEIAFILRSSGAETLLVGPGLESVGREAAAKDTRVERTFWLPGEEPAEPPPWLLNFDDLTAEKDTPLDVTVDSRAPAQIIYTSGTESLPKGAVLSHEAVLWEYVSSIVEGEISGDDVLLHSLPLFHCAQLDCFLGPAVYLGCTNVITGMPRPDVILPLIARHGATSFFAPPSVWISLLRSPLFDTTDLSSLQKGYYGASIMPVEVLLEMQRRLPKVRLWNYYGQTEIAPLATVLKPGDQLRKAGSAGKPVLNVETRVVTDDMRDVLPGEVGEIVHRAPQLLTSYFNAPEKTEEAFAGGWFHSGDLATMDEEGYITIVDRKKDMIKTGGENVASREVEETIFKLPQVSEVAVVGLPDPQWIEAVTAVVVLKEGTALTEAELIAHCRQHMAHFKVPKHVFFTEALPKNPSGKLLKRNLRQQFSPAEAK
ncbi:acyl-CoA synthetase [Pseudothauera rhizosphaerae]|uniref:Long-chain-fatty-acid--CoA ligase n=1 Tax=Pseudothauera rhizosphaerae TaxID=2565932 RepID=A0A4S4APJ0_9RHOO|nr:acyl-CoA synthetase [Pseudothauera rhizosphaerae]THF60350.1 long-chain-fatty-acid--CoA ligase [Pseudothauera rhizosphaerae]